MAPTTSTLQSTHPLKSILKKTPTPSTSSSSNTKAQPQPKSHPLFQTSKRDKRQIKHSQLLSKITKPSATAKRRRRPNKKLIATLTSLADALPTNTDDHDDDDGTGGGGGGKRPGQRAAAVGAGPRPDQQVNVIKRKTLKSRPGAMKRRQNLDNLERARFVRNMAQMAAVHTPTVTVPAPSADSTSNSGTVADQIAQQQQQESRSPSTTASTSRSTSTSTSTARWAALRGFIAETLEKRADIGSGVTT